MYNTIHGQMLKLEWVPQSSILGLLLFLISINDLSDNLSTNIKLFAGNTPPFSVIHNIIAF